MRSKKATTCHYENENNNAPLGSEWRPWRNSSRSTNTMLGTHTQPWSHHCNSNTLTESNFRERWIITCLKYFSKWRYLAITVLLQYDGPWLCFCRFSWLCWPTCRYNLRVTWGWNMHALRPYRTCCIFYYVPFFPSATKRAFRRLY